MKHAVLLLVLGLSLASFAATDKKTGSDTSTRLGQQDSTPTFRAKTALVLIPTIVTDSKGQHINGLKKEDFAVGQDGVHREIPIFEEITTRPPDRIAPSLAPNVWSNTDWQSGADRRLTVIVFDKNDSSFFDQVDGRRQLRYFIEHVLPADEPVALMSLDPAGLTVVSDFSTDPQVFREALANVDEKQIKRAPSIDPAQLELQNLTDRLRLMERGQLFQGHWRTTLLAMRQIGEFFAGIPGKKTVIWVTASMPTVDFSFDWDHLSTEIDDEYSAAYDALSRAQVTVYPLDIGHITEPLGGMYKLDEFASMTGGRVCYHKLDLDDCFRQARSDAAHYYLLGFYTDVTHAKPGWHKLSVAISRSGAKVIARSGFYVNPDASRKAGKRAALRSEMIDLVTALDSPVDFTGVPFHVTVDEDSLAEPSADRIALDKDAAAKARDGKLVLVPFHYSVPIAGLSSDPEHPNQVDVTYSAYATDRDGKIRGWFSKQVRMEIAAGPQQVAREVDVKGDMIVPAGDYVLHFLVRDNVAQHVGSVAAFTNAALAQ